MRGDDLLGARLVGDGDGESLEVAQDGDEGGEELWCNSCRLPADPQGSSEGGRLGDHVVDRMRPQLVHCLV